jgi:hypothetical protein
MTDAPLTVSSYVLTDDWFGAPYLDVDEWRTTIDGAYQYRFVHGGFADSDTRFTCYFPPAADWRGRMLFPVEGGLGGYEDTCETIQGFILDQLGIGFRLGAYVVESNAGHRGVELDARAGEDPSIYGYRAHAESARVSKFVAEQVYGRGPGTSLAYGGGGGGMRAQLCLENTDVFDGAMPYVGVAETMAPSTFEVPERQRFLRSATSTRFGTVLNVHRVLGDKLKAVIDATEPGGSGDPFAGLDTHQREELATLYRLGFATGCEALISEPVGATSAWSWLADGMVAEDPEYFRAFWCEPGYVGHDAPEALAPYLVQTKAVVTRVVTATELLAMATSIPGVGALAKFMVGMKGPDFPCGVVVDGHIEGHLIGASVRIASGAAAGRSLYVGGLADDVWYLDGAGENGTARLAGVVPGDELLVDNRDFLAYCYSYRHHAPPTGPGRPEVDGVLLYPQHPLPRSAALLGGPASGVFTGKLLLLPATHDASVWPSSAVALLERIAEVQGPDAPLRTRIRWMENAENLPGSFIPPKNGLAMTTRFIDYNPLVEQSLHDLAAWVEDGVAPSSTQFAFSDGRLRLAADAEVRGGIQPVVVATANGSSRAEVSVGEPVVLGVDAAVPAGAGAVVTVEWDVDGGGAFAHPIELSPAAQVRLTTTYVYDRPGTYFPSVRVLSHREGATDAKYRLIPNLGRCRVVVS